MRKALVAALVVAFVLSIAATASAAVLTPASFPDVKDLACADAVAKLEALGIAKGIDGQWMPLAPVTRAQFAAFAVRLLGLEGVVKYMAGPTKFADVPATHWASGYVNVAVAKKLLAGYPDGNFHPDENITFPQAATVLGRVLGYVNLPGEWPSNYMVVASENGLFEGVEFGGDFVTRGDMAIMLANALGAQVVQYKYLADLGIADYEKLWDDDAKTNPTTVLEKFLGASVKSGVVTANADVDSTLKAAEIKLDTTKLAVPSKVDTAAILGHDLSAIVKSGNVVFAEDVTASDKIVTGELTANATASAIEIEDTEYEWAGTPIVYFNRVKVSTNVYEPLVEGVKVTAFLDDEGKVRFVAAFSYDVSDELVASTDSTNNTVTVQSGTYKVVSTSKITLNDQAATFADIKKDMVAYIALERGTDKIKVLALYDKKVTGTIVSVTIKPDAKTYIKLADGTELVVSSKYTASLDGSSAGLGSLIGYPATITLNQGGQARVISATAAGVVGKYVSDDATAIKVNVAGTEVSLTKATGFVKEGTISAGTPITVLTNAEGKATKAIALASASWTIKAVDSANNKLTVYEGANVKVYSVGSNAVFELASGAYGSLSDLEVDMPVTGYYRASTALYVVAAAPITPTLYGKYLGSIESDTALTAYLDVKGETVTKAAYNDAAKNAIKTTWVVGKFVYADLLDGKITATSGLFDEAAPRVDGTVVSVSGNTVTVQTGTDAYALVNLAKASIYKGTSKAPATVADVTVGVKVKVYTDTRTINNETRNVDAVVWIQ